MSVVLGSIVFVEADEHPSGRDNDVPAWHSPVDRPQSRCVCDAFSFDGMNEGDLAVLPVVGGKVACQGEALLRRGLGHCDFAGLQPIRTRRIQAVATEFFVADGTVRRDAVKLS